MKHYPARTAPIRFEDHVSEEPVRFVRLPLKTGLLLLATAFAAGFAATAWFVALVLIPAP